MLELAICLVAQEVEGLRHGALVAADCSFQAGRGLVAERIVSIEPFAASFAEDHDALVLRIRTHAEAKNYNDGERLLERLLDLEPTGMPIWPVHAALEALGSHLSDGVLRRLAEFYGTRTWVERACSRRRFR